MTIRKLLCILLASKKIISLIKKKLQDVKRMNQIATRLNQRNSSQVRADLN